MSHSCAIFTKIYMIMEKAIYGSFLKFIQQWGLTVLLQDHNKMKIIKRTRVFNVCALKYLIQVVPHDCVIASTDIEI